MPCQDINVGGSGVLFELNKCQRRGETASKLTLHGAPIKLPMPPPPPAVVSQTLLYRICMSCQSDALKTQNINTLTPSFLSGCRKQTAQTHTNIAAETQILCSSFGRDGGGGKTPCWIIQLDAISRHNARYAPPSLQPTANGTRQWQQLKRDLLQQQQQQEQQLEQQDYGLRTTAAHTADEVAIQSHKHVERGRKVSAKPA
ncbi:LOW QUALITY PROTEIN: probable WRKY transcription factor 21 [Drosophila simulans]|uniref:LOW QUALITY PROTEIN: probable WRKY transcription factor 21 n=1 Tax=Drosophila simulans TaxID=7240 RepID=UPI00078AE74D